MINIYSPRPSKVLFIDEVYIKNCTEVTTNVDPKLMITSIMYNQDKYILPILGNNIFEQWKDWIASGVTLHNDQFYYFDANNLLLFEDYIQPCLAAAVMIELVYKINIQIKNKGLEQAHSEYSSNATDAQVQWLSENYRETAAFYAQRATNFLNANLDIWQNYLNPQLGTQGNGADLFYPVKTKYFCGIFLPGTSTNSNVPMFSEFNGMGMSVIQRMQAMGWQ